MDLIPQYIQVLNDYVETNRMLYVNLEKTLQSKLMIMKV